MSPLFTVYVLCPLAPAAEFPAGLPADEDWFADELLDEELAGALPPL